MIRSAGLEDWERRQEERWVTFGLWLDSMILKVFSNLNDSVIQQRGGTGGCEWQHPKLSQHDHQRYLVCVFCRPRQQWFTVLGASLLEATAVKSPSRAGEKEDVLAPYLFQCTISSLSEVLHSCSCGCRHKFALDGAAAGLGYLAEGHKCEFIAEVQGLLPPPRPYVSAVCTLTQAGRCAHCGLQSGTTASSSSCNARGAVSQSVSVCPFLCPSLQPQALTLPETLQIPISTWWGAII